MTSAPQSAEGSSAPNATIQQSRNDLNRGLVRESFDRILNILQQLSLYEKSPKLFVIYDTCFQDHITCFQNYIIKKPIKVIYLLGVRFFSSSFFSSFELSWIGNYARRGLLATRFGILDFEL